VAVVRSGLSAKGCDKGKVYVREGKEGGGRAPKGPRRVLGGARVRRI